MTKLLNRLALILSLTLGLTGAQILAYFFQIGVGSYSSYSGFDGDEFVGFTIVVGVILGLIFKRIFFSETHITETVRNYAGKIVDMATRKQGEAPSIVKEDKNTRHESMLESIAIPKTEETKEEIHMRSGTEENEKNREEQKISEPVKEEETIDQGPNFIEKFFAENALAKIGGILLFLGVLFFLSLIFAALGPVGKIVIGFMMGFTFFGIGTWLDTRGYANESRTMMGVGILVNYLVVLSGRYLIGDQISGGNGTLSEGTTFFFLILNTIFAIVTSLLYKSKTLLLFSFVFAYLNPFLIGAAGDGTPYTLAGYATIISIGALVLSQFYGNQGDKEFARYLRFVAFIGGNILFLLAPFTTASHWLVKLVLLGVISLATIVLTYKNDDDTDTVGMFFILTYITFGLLLITGGSANILHTGLAFVGYIAFMLVTLAVTAFMIFAGSIAALGYMLFAPLILIFGLLVTGNLFMIVPTILGSLFIYLIMFVFLYESLSVWLKYVFFVLLCTFLGLSNLSLQFVIPAGMDSITHTSVIISSLVFLFASYTFSRREKMEYLYTIGSIGTIFLLLPIIETRGVFMMTSVMSIIVFALANTVTPFINRNLCQQDLKNLALSLVAGILFIGGELYNYGALAQLFPGVTLGYSFMGLAAVYFVLGYAMMGILDIDISTVSEGQSEEKKNAIYGYLGVSISLFSIAILIIFSSQPAIIASIWFFEATILLFFYSRIKDIKIMLGAIVLFIVGILKYGTFIESLRTGDYIQLIPLAGIFISFILNLKFLEKTKEETRMPHDILHAIAMIMVGIGVMSVIPHTGQGFSIFALSIVLVIVGFCYNLFASNILKYAFIIAVGLFYLDHIFTVSDIFATLEANSKGHLKILQYITVLILGMGAYFRNLAPGKFDDVKKFISIPYVVYVFIITTIFVYSIFDHSIFSITIYWSLWAFAYISNGISRDIQNRRTIGLYILTGVILKILCYDVWFGINDAILRVVALMFVGGLMIYISTLYTRKYPGNLLNEFNLSNLTGTDGMKAPSANTEKKTGFVINEKISHVDIGTITMVTFSMNDGKSFKVKSKNLIKIAKLVERKMGKSEFEKNELNEIYSYVLKNYQSELSQTDYKKITEVMKEFVEHGGKVSFE